MPRLSRLFLRAALVYLFLGFTFGALILANKGLPFAPLVWLLLPAHIECMLLGWVTQLALGVAFWILPRLAGNQPRGEERWSWAAFLLINLGLLLALLTPYQPFAWLGFGTHLLQALGFVAFVTGNWPRIYPPVRERMKR